MLYYDLLGLYLIMGSQCVIIQPVGQRTRLN